MSALAGAKTFETYVAAVKALLAGAGIGLSGEKPVPYGLRLDLRQADETVPLTLYYGKKGFSLVLAGKAGALKSCIFDNPGRQAAPLSVVFSFVYQKKE